MKSNNNDNDVITSFFLAVWIYLVLISNLIYFFEKRRIL